MSLAWVGVLCNEDSIIFGFRSYANENPGRTSNEEASN